jgi:CRISPR-associated protein Csx10
MTTRYYPYALTLEAPLLLAALDADPNSARSLDHVPGGAVRGAVARGLCDAGLDRADPYRFRHLILSGRVCYLNAYVAADGRRCLPAPVSLRREKYGEPVHDLAAWTGEEDETAGTLERLATSFVTLGTPEMTAKGVLTTGRAHHQRDRTAGRPVLDRGSVFHFEALDAGQEFHGLLAIHGEESAVASDLQTIREALGPTLLLGRSRHAGYGGAATIQWGEPVPREVEGERILSGYVGEGGVFRLLLTADYLGRDRATGQPDPSALRAEVESRLGGKAQVERQFLAFRTVGGFNRKWGLELPQSPAVRAGSLLVLRAKEHLSGTDLVALEHAGLGERRAEGFGRFVFLDAPGGAVPLRTASETTPEPTGDPPPLVLAMQGRLLDEAVGRRIREAATRIASSAERIPTRSLLSRLRVPLRLPAADGLKQLRAWLGDAEGGLRRAARRQLEACRIGDHGRPWSLYDWLRENAKRSDLGRVLGYDGVARHNRLIGEDAARKLLASAEREVPTRARFLDAVLAALALRSAREVTDVR